MAYSFDRAKTSRELDLTTVSHGSDSKILHSNIRKPGPRVVSANGIYLELDSGRKILDATGGPAVVCIGHGNEDVKSAVMQQMDSLSYCHAFLYSNSPAEELARMVIDSTEGAMSRATIMGSGEFVTAIPNEAGTIQISFRFRSNRVSNEACPTVLRCYRAAKQD